MDCQRAVAASNLWRQNSEPFSQKCEDMLVDPGAEAIRTSLKEHKHHCQKDAHENRVSFQGHGAMNAAMINTQLVLCKPRSERTAQSVTDIRMDFECIDI